MLRIGDVITSSGASGRSSLPPETQLRGGHSLCCVVLWQFVLCCVIYSCCDEEQHRGFSRHGIIDILGSPLKSHSSMTNVPGVCGNEEFRRKEEEYSPSTVNVTVC